MNRPDDQQATTPRQTSGTGAPVGPPARPLAVGLAALLIAWSTWSVGRQAQLALRPPSTQWSPVFAWRAQTPAVEEVRRFAERVAARVPQGEPILFTLAEGGDDEFFLSMWTAYFLPHHRVLRRQNVPPGAVPPRYRLDIPNWPPASPTTSPSVAPEEPGARRLLDGLGSLWFIPSAPDGDAAP